MWLLMSQVLHQQYLLIYFRITYQSILILNNFSFIFLQFSLLINSFLCLLTFLSLNVLLLSILFWSFYFFILSRTLWMLVTVNKAVFNTENIDNFYRDHFYRPRGAPWIRLSMKKNVNIHLHAHLLPSSFSLKYTACHVFAH